MEIMIVKEIGKRCLIQTDGQKIYDQILPVLKNNMNVTLDFDGVEMFASPFFNSSIGQLTKQFHTDDLKKRLLIKNLNKVGDLILKRVIENAITYYQDKDYQKIVDDLLEKQISRE